MAIDINTISKRELTRLRGIGEELAEKIIRARPFGDINDLLELSGVGKNLLNRLVELGVTVGAQGEIPTEAKPSKAFKANVFPIATDLRLLFRPMSLPLLSPIFPIPLFFPDLSSQDIGDMLDRLKGYLKDPSTLVTGPRSTGSRQDAINRWKQSCQEEGETVEENFPKNTGELEWYVWDHIIDGEITTYVKLTWSYDQCNIYDADATLTVQRNDEPEDYGVIMLESYSIPETDPVEQRRCQPCTPKCLKVVLSVIIYASRIGVPGISKQINIEVLLCPSDNSTPNFTDNTDYEQSQGDAGGPRGPNSTPLKPPVKQYQGPENGGWGVSRRTGDGGDDYTPK